MAQTKVMKNFLASKVAKDFFSAAASKDLKSLVIVAPTNGGHHLIQGTMSYADGLGYLSEPGSSNSVPTNPLELPKMPMPMDKLSMFQDKLRSHASKLKAVFLPSRTGSLGIIIIFNKFVFIFDLHCLLTPYEP